MQKKSSPLLLCLALMTILSCSKEDNTIGQNEKNSSQVNISDVLCQGCSVDGAGNTSGVDATTGYEELSKHYVNGVWDGTYTCVWYNHLLTISNIVYMTNTINGDPVAAYIRSGLDVTITPITKIGDEPTAFKMEYIVWNPTVTQYIYTITSINDYNTALLNWWIHDFSHNPSSLYPKPDAPVKIVTTGGSSKTITDYGKLIKISTGSGLAIAELGWAPSSNSTSGCTTTRCQYCQAHPEDPTCQP